MTYDHDLADRVRTGLSETEGIEEKEMFGGLSFLLNGHMTIGVAGDELMVRVGKERDAEALARDGARPMDFTGRPMRGWISVAAPGFGSDAELAWWIEAGLLHARGLPPK